MFRVETSEVKNNYQVIVNPCISVFVTFVLKLKLFIFEAFST